MVEDGLIQAIGRLVVILGIVVSEGRHHWNIAKVLLKHACYLAMDLHQLSISLIGFLIGYIFIVVEVDGNIVSN